MLPSIVQVIVALSFHSSLPLLYVFFVVSDFIILAIADTVSVIL